MTTRDEKRGAAVRAHEERAAAEQKRKANAEAERENRQQKERQAQQAWMANAIQIIRAGVQASSDGFARQGSRYVVGAGDDTSPYSVSFKIVPGGRPTHIEASFTFSLRDGLVCPDTTAVGCEDFPAPVPVDDLKQDWVEDVADSAIIAVLGGQWRIPK